MIHDQDPFLFHMVKCDDFIEQHHIDIFEFLRILDLAPYRWFAVA